MQTLNKQSILVTGASGFLGSVIAEHFRKRGARVVGTARSHQCQNNQVMLYLDLENPANLKILDTKRPYDAVIHCAAALPGKMSDLGLLSVNQKMTYNLVEWALDGNVRNFLFASGCNIYGSTDEPCIEPTIPNPPNMYAVSKVACEYMLNAMAAGTNMKVCILRISAPYGPSLRADTVIKHFLKQVARNGEITLMGSGGRSQDFVYQDDVALAFYKALLHNAVGIFNISGNQSVSMQELAEIILAIFDKNCDDGIIFSGVDPQESYRGCFPIATATSTFGYFPQINLEDGLRLTAQEWRVMRSITCFLKPRLRLSVNERKSRVASVEECSFLGFTFRRGRIRWTQNGYMEFKRRIRLLIGRSWFVSMEYPLRKLTEYIRGWMNYFGISEYYRPIPELEAWLRRRIRMCYWKQWRKTRTKVRRLIKLGASKRIAILTALSRKGYWRLARILATHTGMTNE